MDVMEMADVVVLYWPGCRRDKDGYYWITGRIDDMLNVSGESCSLAQGMHGWHTGTCSAIHILVSLCFCVCVVLCAASPGHLLSTAEVESALVEHEAVDRKSVV